MKNIKKIIEFIIFPLLLSIFSFTLYQNIQPIIDYETCNLCDALKYKKIYENFINHSYNAVHYPFYTRVLTPFLASILSPNDVIKGFQYSNFIFLIFTNVSLYFIWKYQLKISFLISLIGLIWINFHWTGIPRYYNLHVINVDVGAIFFESITILLLIQKRFNWFLLIAPLAAFQKESYTIIFLVITIYYTISNFIFNTLSKNDYKILITAFILVTILKYIFIQLYPSLNQESTLRYVYFQTLEIVDDPVMLVKILVCFFIGFGCFVWIGFIKYSIIDFNDEIKTVCFFITLLHIIFAIIGGRDLTRIMFLGFPFVMTLALLKLNECRDITKLATFILSIPLMRISEDIPDAQKNIELNAKWHLEAAIYYDQVAAWGVYAIFCYIVLYHLENNNQSHINTIKNSYQNLS
jgi:hypothetical protein